MPIFIPILIIVGAGLVAGAAAVGFAGIIAAIAEALKGKRLAVLGEGKVGKTVLIDFLTKGVFSKEYVRTVYPKDTEANDFKLEDLELKINESRDVPGNDDYYSDWEDIFKKANIVLYLLRTDKLMEGHKPTEDRVKKDMGQIGRWLKKYPKKFPLLIVGTYCDLTTPDLTMLPEDERRAYENKIRGMPIFQEIALRGGGGRKVRFLFGSLKSKETTEHLAFEIINQAAKSQ